MNSIVIIGGGPAGLALAAGLSNLRDNRVTVVEKTNYDRIFSGEHVQSQILPILEDLKIPLRILAHNSIVCDGIVGRWANRDILRTGIFSPYGRDYIVNRPAFERALANHLIKKGVRFLYNAFPKSISCGKVLAAGETIPYDYIFDCSGRTSPYFNGQRLVFDRLIGTSYYSSESDRNCSTIVIESAENGWWYHTSNKKLSITTYFSDSDQCEKRKTLLEVELNKTEIVKKYCTKLKGLARRQPAYTSILRSPPSQILQLGDSYMSLDPLSSQGIFKGFSQAAQISDCFGNNFETLISRFYLEQRKSFLRNLRSRELYYREGVTVHNSEFYRRRVQLNIESVLSEVKTGERNANVQ